MTLILRYTLAFVVLGFLIGSTPAIAEPGVVIGISAQGAPIRAYVLGNPEATTRVVVLGQMHGNEPAGTEVISALRKLTPPDDTALWLIPTMNPDGQTQSSRTNARGVDLNRNFPSRWREQGAGTNQWSGPRAASETETQALMAFLQDLKPTAVLSLHQPFGVVDITHPPARQAGRLLARWMGLPARAVDCSGPCHGTLTEWATRELHTVAITVELPATVTPAGIDRTSTAIMRLAAWMQRTG